ncbi:MAG: hypothetical protein DRJ35_05705 [Thermoprotei archaeon]|nr:MAG: hypothetical protein DRJ35_05705 [Thermoprotei archaeon]
MIPTEKKRLGFGEHLGMVIVILLTIFLIGSATGVQRTVISIYAKEFVESSLLAFLPVVVFGLCKGTIDLFGGWLSDKTGRKVTFVLGTTVYLLGTISIVAIKSLTGILLGNVLIGLGQGMIFAAAMIALSDISGSEEAGMSFGFMEAFVYGGYGAGSVIAGFLWQMYTIQTPFYYSLASAGTALGIATLVVKETKHLVKLEERAKVEEKEIPTIDAYKISITTPSLLTTFLAAHVAKFTDALAWAAFPLLFASKGFGDVEIGILQGIVTFSWALSMPFFGKLSDRAGRKLLVTIGLILKGIGILLLLGAPDFYTSLYASLIVGISYGMYYPILPAITVDIAPLQIKGRVLGLYRSIRDLGYFTGALVIGYITDAFGFRQAFEFTAGLVFLAAFLVIIIIKETRPIWPFFNLVVKHVETMRNICETHKKLLEEYLREDLEGARRLLREIKELEHEGDRLKIEIMDKIWSSRLPFGDRMDFERIVQTLDMIAGCLYQSGEKLLRRKRSKVPDTVIEGLKELTGRLGEAIELFKRNIEVLRISPLYALKLTEDIRKMESSIDSVTEDLLGRIEELLEKGEIDVATFVILKDIIDLHEYAADDLKDASDIVRIVSLKHAT